MKTHKGTRVARILACIFSSILVSISALASSPDTPTKQELQVILAMDQAAQSCHQIILKLDREIESKPSASAYVERANFKLGLGGGAFAIRDCDLAMKLWPESPLPYITRARIKAREKDYLGALNDLTTAIALCPTDADLFIRRARVRLLLDDLDEALADANAAIKLAENKSANARLIRARVLYQQGQVNAAENEALQVGKEFHAKGGGAEIDLLLDIYINKMEYKKALKVTNKRVIFCYQCEDKIRVYMAMKDYKKVRSLATDSINAANVPVPGVYAERAKARLLLGDIKGAVDDYREELFHWQDITHEGAGGIPEYLEDLAIPLFLLNRQSEVLAYCDHWNQLFPADTLTHGIAGDTYMQTGQYSNAVFAYNTCIVKSSSNKNYVSGYYYFFRHIAACLSAQRASPLDRLTIPVQCLKGWQMFIARYLAQEITEADLLAAAKASNENADLVDSQLCEAYYYIGVIHLLANDKNAARSHFEQCLAFKLPEYTESLFARAELTRLGTSE